MKNEANALQNARDAVEVGRSVIAVGAGRLADLSCPDGRLSIELLDRHQILAYDLAHGASAVEAGGAILDYGEHGELESLLARAFVADALWDVGCRLFGRRNEWGVGLDALGPAEAFVEEHRHPEFLERLAVDVDRRGAIPTNLPDDFELVRQTFHRFAAERVRPVAEHVHRENADIPEEVIAGIAELGGFGLSVPAEYGGNATGDDSDYLGMLVATEELSWGSLGVGGSLPTRPEVLTRAIVGGGTEEQKRHWLPRIATGEAMVAVTVTEPDYGSDVANLSTTATPVDGGWRVNGVKTWATFAGRANTLMLLARTDPDRSLG
ncbi:MAG: acyl-CoA dehydrogenase family protein, partial [Acidimicrobiia bacterium]